jgi:hypothetical protein
MLDDEDKLVPFGDWDTLDQFSIQDYGVEAVKDPDHEKKYYANFIYYSKVAKKIISSARCGKFSKGGRNNPLIFANGFEMRIKMDEGYASKREPRYFYFTDGVEKIEWKDTEDERCDIAFGK